MSRYCLATPNYDQNGMYFRVLFDLLSGSYRLIRPTQAPEASHPHFHPANRSPYPRVFRFTDTRIINETQNKNYPFRVEPPGRLSRIYRNPETPDSISAAESRSVNKPGIDHPLLADWQGSCRETGIRGLGRESYRNTCPGSPEGISRNGRFFPYQPVPDAGFLFCIFPSFGNCPTGCGTKYLPGARTNSEYSMGSHCDPCRENERSTTTGMACPEHTLSWMEPEPAGVGCVMVPVAAFINRPGEKIVFTGINKIVRQCSPLPVPLKIKSAPCRQT